MKKLFFIILATTFFLWKSHSQSVVVTYNIETRVPDATQEWGADVQDFALLMADRIKDYQGTLTIGKSQSKYITSSSIAVGDDSSVDLAAEYTLNSKDVYYIRNDSVTQRTNLLLQPLILKYKPVYEWQLLSEGDKEINGILCYKAICTHLDIQGNKKQVEAYYAPSLPYSVGPVEYMGLPGLILEVKANNLVYTLRDIKEVKDPEEIKIPHENILTLEEFRVILDAAEKKFEKF